MAPKTSNVRGSGDLNSWLRSSSHTNGQHKRQRSTDIASDSAKEPSEKKQKSTTKGQPPAKESTPSRSPGQKVASSSNTNTRSLTLINHTGDIFAAPPHTLLIHACNCDASWSAGIAAAFKKHSPSAFQAYAKHCKAHTADALVGTALLIPPAAAEGVAEMKGKVGAPRIAGRGSRAIGQGKAAGAGKGGAAGKHFVGCLFTSRHYGKRRDSPSKILEATGPAMRDLLEQVRGWNEAHSGDGAVRVEKVRICKINSGLFGVPWEDTVEVLEGIGLDEGDGGSGDGKGGDAAVSEIEVWEREEG